jgi:L-ascorbate metabolism protein UlaG (beta-lactamase superfamily)
MEIDGHQVLFDPFLTGNPFAAASPNDFNPEIIFLSHAHGDHVGDSVSIAKRTNAMIVCNAEMSYWFSKQGVARVSGQNTGGSGDYGFASCKLTIAFHSSSFADGTYGGQPNGLVVTAYESGLRLYFAGDTALFGDMSLIGAMGIDVAFLPIGDYFTMGIDDSLAAIRLVHPRYVVPMHYSTFPVIQQDAGEWASKVNNSTDAQPIVLDPGGSFTVTG